MKDSLLEVLDHSFSGIIWATKTIPSSDHKYFNTIDYILNGLPRKNLLNNKDVPQIFFTQAFDERFFVIHMIDGKHFHQQLYRSLCGLKNQIPLTSKILYINEDKTYLQKTLSLISSVLSAPVIVH